MGNVAAALDLIVKYAQYIPILVEAGANVAEVVGRITSLAEGAKEGAISDEVIAEHRQELDNLIAEFNTPMD